MPDVVVRVTPRAHREGVGPFEDGVLHVRVTRPPSEGEANRAVSRLVADALDVAPSRVSIAAGERARRKRLVVDGISSEELVRRLDGLPRD
jgi:uncharacterized protein YggU (UPF0235/DUF167 family)